MPIHRVMTVIGTRPEAIKMAPIIQAINASPHLRAIVAVTGQHRELLDQVTEHFGIRSDIDLDIFSPGQTLDSVTVRILKRLTPHLVDCAPDAIMVQGDTTSAFTSSLAAFYKQIPVIHVEAGLRTQNLMSPFPEEANRRLVSRLTALHLAPTEESKANLMREAVTEHSIVVTGNSVIDALLGTIGRPVAFTDPALADLVATQGQVVLVTTHRREAWGEPMKDIGRALATLATRFPEVSFVLPLHGNPAVREALEPALRPCTNVVITSALEYPQFAALMNRSAVVLTDSGGVQEEAPSLGKPVLVMRENTERPEAVSAGTVRVVGTRPERIVAEMTRLLTDPAAYEAMARAVNPYGDGHAAARSVAAVEHFFGTGERMLDFSPQPA